jgi:crotonobetainyl-CoA:carnitine CoA-transferase CaiB-like acyl-CoA transferase
MLPLPLALVRVVDLTRSAGGAVAGRHLADLGAEVIVVEPIADTRQRESGALAPLLRNKFSCQLDTLAPRGRELCLRLTALADIVMLDAHDPVLDLDELSTAEPDGIVVSFEDGRERPGTGVTAAAAALTALLHRRVTGQGQLIQVSVARSRASLLSIPILATSAGISEPSPDLPLSGVYRCRDGGVAIALRSVEQLAALGEAIGRPEHVDALSGGVELREPLTRWTAGRSVVETEQELIEMGVPAQRLLTPDVLQSDPHLRSRGFLESVAEDDTVRNVEGVPFRFSRTPAHIRLPAPETGQHTEYVLSELLHLTAAEIEELRREGMVGQP